MNHIASHARASALGAIAALALAGASAQAAVTFDDLPLAPQSHYFPQASTTFTDGGVSFNHDYEPTYGSWSGWTYANETDTTTEGYENQFSAYTGGGQGGSANYGLSFVNIDYATAQNVPSIATLATPSTVAGAYFTNMTYSALSMLNGDGFAKRFGGDSGNDPDFFKLTIQGIDATGLTTGSVDFYLADYRFADNSQDYIIDKWTYVDLSSLGTVSKLSFNLSSSDVGAFGMNTPAYFAIDSLQVSSAVPENGTAAMMLAGLMGVGLMARRRRSN